MCGNNSRTSSGVARASLHRMTAVPARCIPRARLVRSRIGDRLRVGRSAQSQHLSRATRGAQVVQLGRSSAPSGVSSWGRRLRRGPGPGDPHCRRRHGPRPPRPRQPARPRPRCSVGLRARSRPRPLRPPPTADIDALASSGVVAGLLPAVELSTRSPYPDARRLLTPAPPLSLASNCNPVPAYSSSMPHCIALAVREMHMSPAEASGQPPQAAPPRSAATTWPRDRRRSRRPGRPRRPLLSPRGVPPRRTSPKPG